MPRRHIGFPAASRASFGQSPVLFMYSPSPLDGGKAGANGGAVERAARVLATLKLPQQGLETFPADKRIEHALRSAERAIQEQEKRVAECERRQKEGE